MILIAGATGQLGGVITRNLLDQGERVRILVRDSSSYDHLVAAGAQPVIGDLKDPGSLVQACDGVQTAITTANSTARSEPDTLDSVDRRGNRNLIDAAEATGVRRFLFVSALGAHPDNPLPILSAKGETEQRLRQSAMAWTILQPNLFMDILIPIVVGEPALSDRPVTLAGNGHRHHSFVAMSEVVAYAVAALNDSRTERATLMIGGPEPVSWRDVVARFERELGHEVPVRTVPLGEPIPALPDFVTQLLAGLENYDSPVDMNELSRVHGVRQVHLVEFVHSFVLAGRPQCSGMVKS